MIAAPEDLRAYAQDSLLCLHGEQLTRSSVYKVERSTNDMFTENVVENFSNNKYISPDTDVEWDWGTLL